MRAFSLFTKPGKGSILFSQLIQLVMATVSRWPQAHIFIPQPCFSGQKPGEFFCLQELYTVLALGVLLPERVLGIRLSGFKGVQVGENFLVIMQDAMLFADFVETGHQLSVTGAVYRVLQTKVTDVLCF